MKNELLFEIRNVTKTFYGNRSIDRADNTALKDVSLEVYEGEILGIIGTSGSGKTTLLRCVLGLEKPDAGDIIFRGKEVHHLNGSDLFTFLRSKVRLIYQHPEAVLNPGLKINEILKQPYYLYNDGNDKVDEEINNLLEEIGLPTEYLGKFPGQLSGGEKRRVSIARALITKPEILFADEPFAGLDKILQFKMLKLLMGIKKEHNLTLVMISHDVDIMREIVDRLIIMDAGNIVETATRKNGKFTFKEEFSKKLTQI